MVGVQLHYKRVHEASKQILGRAQRQQVRATLATAKSCGARSSPVSHPPGNQPEQKPRPSRPERSNTVRTQILRRCRYNIILLEYNTKLYRRLYAIVE